MFLTPEKPAEKPASDSAPSQLSDEFLKDLLKAVEDPDLGMNIVDLGLIYGVKNTDGKVAVDMTLTTPSCPHGPQMVSEVNYVLKCAHGVKEVNVNIVWDPPWSMDFLTEDAKLELGIDS